MTREEKIEILEEIARNGPATARIAAIKTLNQMQQEEGDDVPEDDLEALLAR